MSDLCSKEPGDGSDSVIIELEDRIHLESSLVTLPCVYPNHAMGFFDAQLQAYCLVFGASASNIM